MSKPRPGTKTAKPPPLSSFWDTIGPPEIGFGLVALVLIGMIVRHFLPSRPPRRASVLAPLPASGKLQQYTIGDLLADGGTATVYKGEDADGTPVAVKIPHLDQVRHRDFVKTFQREAEIGVELRHPSIVRVLAVGTYHNKGQPHIPYFVMELLEGQELDQIIRSSGPLDAASALQVARSVADALAWAHQRGVVHRDISPRNIFITSKKTVKVMDFGISTVSSRFTGKKASTGLTFGTPEYLAPERSLNLRSGDARSDLYSLGCVIYEMLVGHPPYQGATPEETIALHRKSPIPQVRDQVRVSSQIEAIVTRLMQKDPAQRYQTAGEVTAALAELVEDV